MVEFLRQLSRFLTTMDAKAITSLSVSLILLSFVVFMLFFGQAWLNLEEEVRFSQLSRLLNAAAQSPYALIGVVSIYSLLALTGFPQILLFAVTIMVFGPIQGALFCWIATMSSATLTFGLGHFLGGRWVSRLGDGRVARTVNFLHNHGVLASALIRVVPSAPFIVVNAAAGTAHIPMWKFWLGTGFGILPKIGVVAVLAAMMPDTRTLAEGVDGVVAFFTSREPQDLAIIAGVIALWLCFLLLVRWIYRRLRARESAY
ncbi:MAG: VTT domain-containing protein [Pseudomonadota bacterium]